MITRQVSSVQSEGKRPEVTPAKYRGIQLVDCLIVEAFLNNSREVHFGRDDIGNRTSVGIALDQAGELALRVLVDNKLRIKQRRDVAQIDVIPI